MEQRHTDTSYLTLFHNMAMFLHVLEEALGQCHEVGCVLFRVDVAQVPAERTTAQTTT